MDSVIKHYRITWEEVGSDHYVIEDFALSNLSDLVLKHVGKTPLKPQSHYVHRLDLIDSKSSNQMSKKIILYARRCT